MGVDDDNPPLDDRAKRTRELLSSFYSSDHTVAPPLSPMTPTFDSINSHSFDHDLYMNSLTQKSNLEGLLQRHVEMAAEIKNIDTDLQMLVYENYNKFISATDTIKRMKNNIVGMEADMDQLLEKITSVRHRSDVVNTSLFEKREHIEKLHRTRNLLHKIQFIYDLPARLAKCIKSESYIDAVKYYTGALPIFVAYGDSSFEDCHRESKKAVQIITKNLQEKVCSNLEPVKIRAEAASLLKQLDFPVEVLEEKLLGNINNIFACLQLESEEIHNFPIHSDEHSKQEFSNSSSTDLHKSTIPEFVDAIHACKVIFPSSELQLRDISHDLVGKRFKIIEECIKRRLNSENFLGSLKRIWTDVLLIDEVLPEVSILDFIFKTGQPTVKLYIDSVFSHLLLQISDVVMKARDKKDGIDTELQLALEAGKIALIQGGMDALLEFRQLLDDELGILVKLRDEIIYWIQVGFQNFFKVLKDRFMKISGQINIETLEEVPAEIFQVNKIPAGIVLLLAQLSLFIERTVVPRIVEEITASFSVGGLRGYKNSVTFVPNEICDMFRAASENFLQLYIKRKAQKISTLLRKRFGTPNWVKHKEPREVHMFVDLFLQELEGAEKEVRQVLPEGVRGKHRRSDSAGSSISSRSNQLREDRMTRSNTQRGRHQLFETHLAKLFKQKVEIFTKIDFTQESVMMGLVKLCLKSLQEYARMHMYNRSGFQQIQVDAQFLRAALKDTAENSGLVDFLLDEVVIAAGERCLDATSLEQAILNKLVHAKLAELGKRPFIL